MEEFRNKIIGHFTKAEIVNALKKSKGGKFSVLSAMQVEMLKNVDNSTVKWLIRYFFF